MPSIRGPEIGTIAKPEPKPRGGKKPKDAGRRYERQFSHKYGFQRVVGSGAFGGVDPLLKGDVKGQIGSLKLLFELKSLNKLDSKGAKTVTFPVSWLDKIDTEAQAEGRFPIFAYHVKGETREWAVIRMDKLIELINDYERQIEELSSGN